MLKKILAIILFLSLIGIILISSSENESKINSDVYKSLEKNDEVKVIVELKDSKDKIKDEIIDNVGEENVRHVFDKEVAVDISKDDLLELKNNPNVKSVIIDKPIFAFLQDSVPLINASIVWSINISNQNLTGFDETICILDTGANFSHPDLIGKNKTCVIDCVNKACVENCSVGDDHGHGTHVAGIAAASGSIRGVAIGANLIAVKVLDSGGSGSTSDVNAGIDWCIANANTYNISVISMSLGTNCVLTPEYCYSHYCDNEASETSTALRIDNATSRNISVIIATGNNGNYTAISSPACIKNATAVGWSNKDETISGSSNRNNMTDLIAPGTSINSTKGLSSCLSSCTCSGNYMICSGTSMAAPHVAGAFALFRQFFRMQNNRVPAPSEIENITNSTGKRIADGSSGLNFSRIDIYSALISIDILNPSVNLLNPLNGINQFQKDLNFSCYANDVKLSNITLYIWNSSSVYNNTEMRYTNGTSISAEFNITNIPFGDYKWNCLAYDHKGNFSFASSNYSFYIGNVSVSLNSPANNTYTNQNSTSFNCSAESETTKRLTNITFYLWNSTDLIYNSTQNISGNLNSSVFNYTFSNESDYHWNCQAYNNASSNNFANSNYTITFDISKPNISLASPSDSSSYSSNSQSITFSYSVSDNFNIRNCSLIINNAVSVVNSSIANLSLNHSFTQSFSPESYNWMINCTDYAGNQENSSQRSFTVSSPPVVVASSGGGGGGVSYTTYSINYKEGEKGYTKELSKDDRIKFSFFDKKAEEHLIVLSKIGENFANITISSKPINLILGIGQSAKLNLTSPNYYDLYLKLESIENNKAKLIIQLINEKIKEAVKEKIIEKIINNTQEIENPETKKKQELTEFELKKLKNIIFMFVLIFVIIFFMILFIINRNRKVKNKEKKIKEYKEVFNKHIRPR